MPVIFAMAAEVLPRARLEPVFDRRNRLLSLALPILFDAKLLVPRIDALREQLMPSPRFLAGFLQTQGGYSPIARRVGLVLPG